MARLSNAALKDASLFASVPAEAKGFIAALGFRFRRKKKASKEEPWKQEKKSEKKGSFHRVCRPLKRQEARRPPFIKAKAPMQETLDAELYSRKRRPPLS